MTRKRAKSAGPPQSDENRPTAHRLWGGRFAGGSDAALDALNRSIEVDFRLWPFDVRVSKAWARALAEAGVLSAADGTRIAAGLDSVAARISAGELPAASDEDVHTMIDRLLHDEIGDVASRLHAGRSRNDQVATASRMWAMAACAKLDDLARALQSALLSRAESVTSAMMPAYTHMQRAQPVTAAHWLMSHFWPLERDRARLAAASSGASVLPLGSGAVAGTAFPVSRETLRQELGFASISPNSIDAVADRDFVAELLFAIALMAAHVSRLAEDMIVLGSNEFGFVRFGERFSTGSSMMPQKRNPDAFELARGNAARALGDLVSLLATLKGLPSGYNKDLQDDKRALFDAVDSIALVLDATAGAVAELSFDRDRMKRAVSAGMMATDLADHLVEKGVPFRDAHRVVGALVRDAEQRGVELDALPSSVFTAAHDAFGGNVSALLSAERSIERRSIPGGTGADAVKAQLEAAHRALT